MTEFNASIRAVLLKDAGWNSIQPGSFKPAQVGVYTGRIADPWYTFLTTDGHLVTCRGRKILAVET
jgi:hypothetical protein